MASEIDIKIVIVGDGAIGKTCLFQRYIDDTYSEDYVPTVFENYDKVVVFDDQTVHVHLWDTAGQEDFDRLRPLSYEESNIVLVSFCILDPDSLENVKQKWYPEVVRYAPKAQTILVGTKSDLRGNEAMIRKIGREPVSVSAAKTVASDNAAICFFECSAKTGDGVASIFEKALSSAMYARTNQESSGGGNCCSVM